MLSCAFSYAFSCVVTEGNSVVTLERLLKTIRRTAKQYAQNPLTISFPCISDEISVSGKSSHCDEVSGAVTSSRVGWARLG